MFSGIVEMTGIILTTNKHDDCIDFTIVPLANISDISIGESIAVNGVCLTVTSFTDEHFCVTAVPETLRLTNLSKLQSGDIVNLEQSIFANSRIGGHFVQGHVDGLGQILDIQPEGDKALIAKITIPEYLSQFIVAKGYIALDGMSITIVDVGDDWFTVTLIPHTRAITIAQQYHIGTLINIEVDMMGKYIHKMLGNHMHALTN